jgi:hypothetical protein
MSVSDSDIEGYRYLEFGNKGLEDYTFEEAV